MFCHLAYSDVMVNGILQPDGVGRCIGELHNLVTPGKVPEGVASLDRIPRRIMVDSYPHEDEAATSSTQVRTKTPQGKA